MNIPISNHCLDLAHVETPPTPQLLVDLNALEYRKTQMAPEQWLLVMACYWVGWIDDTLKKGRN